MTSISYADHEYLLLETRKQFPVAEIAVSYPEDEVIVVVVDGESFRFEASSDDDEYLFVSANKSFRIPLMPESEL